MQDPAALFVVTSLTGYSSRRNQFVTQLLFHMEWLWFARCILNVGVGSTASFRACARIFTASLRARVAYVLT